MLESALQAFATFVVSVSFPTQCHGQRDKASFQNLPPTVGIFVHLSIYQGEHGHPRPESFNSIGRTHVTTIPCLRSCVDTIVAEKLIASVRVSVNDMPRRRCKATFHSDPAAHVLILPLHEMFELRVSAWWYRTHTARLHTKVPDSDRKLLMTAPRHTKSGTTPWMCIISNWAVEACHWSPARHVLMRLLQQTTSGETRCLLIHEKKKVATCQLPVERQVAMLRSKMLMSNML